MRPLQAFKVNLTNILQKTSCKRKANQNKLVICWNSKKLLFDYVKFQSEPRCFLALSVRCQMAEQTPCVSTSHDESLWVLKALISGFFNRKHAFLLSYRSEIRPWLIRGLKCINFVVWSSILYIQAVFYSCTHRFNYI